VLVAVAASLAGCVGMPNSGSPGTFSATPQDTAPDSNFIGVLPAGPGANWKPREIVQGFLYASTFPAYNWIAQQYLASAAKKTWNPRWSVKVLDRVVPGSADVSANDRSAIVDVTSTVRASFDGTGQYVGAQQSRGGAQTRDQQFKLVKVDGQWRITNPPNFRMLTEPDFSQVFKPQDLYFFDPGGQVIVPDAVFVPAASPQSSLVNNLVQALLNNPQPDWLQNGTAPPAVTEFPSVTKILSVDVYGTTATVNLGGAAANASYTTREQISAQLVWTLTGPQSSLGIQAVQLEINGTPWIPSRPPCGEPGGLSQSPAQKQFMYSCYNPYPAATSAAFYYASNGQAWTRCAPESQVMTGYIGSVLPVFSRTGGARLGQSCGDSVPTPSQALPPAQPHSLPPLSMVAVSPDNKYAAGVSPSRNTVDVWGSAGTKPSSSLTVSGVTAIAWDRRDDLWVAHDNTTTMNGPPGDSSSSHVDIPNAFEGKIIGLGIAPDGVRVAAIVQTASGSAVQLAAIDTSRQSSNQLSNPSAHTSAGQPTSIGPTVRLGPNITNPIALTWYDADDLLVLDRTSTGTTLWDVPVDGQQATKSPGFLPGAISITANSAQNALVVGLSGGGGRMEVSAGLEGPWQTLGSGGQNPAFPVPAIPVAAQS
jgi:hypothetical protein